MLRHLLTRLAAQAGTITIVALLGLAPLLGGCADRPFKDEWLFKDLSQRGP